MTADRTLNTEALLDTIYQIQVDLTLLVEQLARDRNPDSGSGVAILDLAALSRLLRAYHPSLSRH